MSHRSRWFRWAKFPSGPLGLSSVPDATNSTLTNGTWAVTADGTTAATLTYTAKDANGTVLPGKSVTMAVARKLVSAASSVVTPDRATMVNDGTSRTYVTLFLYDGDGNPLVGVPAASCVLAVNGAGNTVTQPTGVTSYTGSITGSYVTSEAATKVASFTVAGLSITDTASTVASGAGGFAAPDMADGDFTGANDTARSGMLHDGVNVAFLVSGANNWTYDATGINAGPSGTVTYPASGGNIGDGGYITNGVLGASIPGSTKACYMGMWHKFDAAADLGDAWKGIRFETAIAGGHSGTFNFSARTIFWDNLNSSLTYTSNVGSMPTALDARGTAHFYEVFWDISDETGWLLQCKVWIDEVLYFDYTGGAATARAVGARSALSLTQMQLVGVVNRLDSESTQWVGPYGLSSTRIGTL